MANFFKKTSGLSKYLAGMMTFLAISQAIWVFQASYIDILESSLMEAMWTMKAFMFSSSMTLATSFLLMISIYRVGASVLGKM